MLFVYYMMESILCYIFFPAKNNHLSRLDSIVLKIKDICEYHILYLKKVINSGKKDTVL